MKKIFSIMCLLLMFFFSITIFASKELLYINNIFTDETSIEEDFKNLQMDITNYFQPKYDYNKWYVVAMSESYANENYDIQTYFYIFNPKDPKIFEDYWQDLDDVGEEHYQRITYFKLKYTLSGIEKEGFYEVVSINYEHHIYKVKGFVYEYTSDAEIVINSVQNYTSEVNGLDFISESTFKAVCNHSKINGFNVELNFNSTLIIDETQVVDVEIPSETLGIIDTFKDVWKKIWQGDWLDGCKFFVTFYNFNFPKNIKPDSIEYAKFAYQENYTYEKRSGYIITEQNSSSSKIINEYYPGSHKYRKNEYSAELEFETFVLGNRISKGEFGYIEFNEEEKAMFNYDCSILLDSHAKNNKTWYTFMEHQKVEFTTIEKTELSEVELLELWYKKDGILYKCQVVSQPDDPIEIHPTVKKNWWEIFLEFLVKMFDFIFYNMFHFKFWVPDIAKQIISGIILGVGLFKVLPKLINWLKKLKIALFGEKIS